MSIGVASAQSTKGGLTLEQSVISLTQKEASFWDSSWLMEERKSIIDAARVMNGWQNGKTASETHGAINAVVVPR
jgi:hypothetical protein